MTEAGKDGGRRAVRSYVLRSSRLSPGKARTMERLYPVHGVDVNREAFDWAAEFPQSGSLHAEIGIGSGEGMVAFAAANPGAAIVGFEVYPPGVASALRGIEEAGIANAKVAMCDAVEILPRMFGPGSLDGMRIFYPDPWQKKRHRKRRMVNEGFLGMVAALTAQGGVLHFATDWPDYADGVRGLVAASGDWSLVSFGSGGEEFRRGRAVTRFERRAEREGRKSWDLVAERAPAR